MIKEITEEHVKDLIENAANQGVKDVEDRTLLYLKRACLDLDIDYLSIDSETKERILKYLFHSMILIIEGKAAKP